MSRLSCHLTLLLSALLVNFVIAEDAARPAAASKNWPLFRGDPLSSGVAHTTLPEKPELLWKFTVKDGAFDSTAAIADGVVYIGDLDGTLYAIDLVSGKEIWKQKFAAGFIAAPAA